MGHIITSEGIRSEGATVDHGSKVLKIFVHFLRVEQKTEVK